MEEEEAVYMHDVGVGKPNSLSLGPSAGLLCGSGRMITLRQYSPRLESMLHQSNTVSVAG